MFVTHNSLPTSHNATSFSCPSTFIKQDNNQSIINPILLSAYQSNHKVNLSSFPTSASISYYLYLYLIYFLLNCSTRRPTNTPAAAILITNNVSIHFLHLHLWRYIHVPHGTMSYRRRLPLPPTRNFQSSVPWTKRCLLPLFGAPRDEAASYVGLCRDELVLGGTDGMTV